MLASGLFILIILFIGLPMWWKTTEVSRVPLPYDDIKALTATPLIVRCTVIVYAAVPERSAALIGKLRGQFPMKGIVDQGDEEYVDMLQVEFEQVNLNAADAATAKTWMDLEQKVLQKRRIVAGEFLFMEWNELENETPNVDVLVQQERTALISPKASKCSIILVKLPRALHFTF